MINVKIEGHIFVASTHRRFSVLRDKHVGKITKCHRGMSCQPYLRLSVNIYQVIITPSRRVISMQEIPGHVHSIKGKTINMGLRGN